jgi:hypothetical protein
MRAPERIVTARHIVARIGRSAFLGVVDRQ